ncbi:MAG: S9 family peptidase [Mucilaginibacter sp.]|nr:S9 family peptidase [Mucilaginibacter sp.]
MFTNDAKAVVFLTAHDSLAIFQLGKGNIDYTPKVNSFRHFSAGNREWLAYRQATELHITAWDGKACIQLAEVSDYWFDPYKASFLLRRAVGGQDLIYWLDPNNKRLDTIYQGNTASSLNPDFVHRKLWFLTDTSNGRLNCYNLASGKPEELSTVIFPDSLQLQDIDRITPDGNTVLLNFKRPSNYIDTAGVHMRIWNATSVRLPKQQEEAEQSLRYEFAYTSGVGRLVQVATPDEHISELLAAGQKNYGLIFHCNGDFNEAAYDTRISLESWVVDFASGSRKKMDHWFCQARSNGRYVLYYDPVKKVYRSYDVTNGKVRNLTGGLHVTWNGAGNYSSVVNTLACWDNSGHYAYLYDEFDIWKIDLSGKHLPLNLTKGFGRKNRLIFRFLQERGNLLSCFNPRTKEHGFYRLTEEGPVRLITGPYLYALEEFDGMTHIKASNANVYLVQRMSATESPNYFLTANFKTFKPISNVYPERTWNWLSSEVMRWPVPRRDSLAGVIYKPENFDPAKKYPVIFFYYERKSDLANKYISPGFSLGDINIPWFVSKGYIVFTPDIDYDLGKPGESALRAIESGRKALAKFPWVDTLKMALSGHSFGGFETNYIITRTRGFAAAISASGLGDMISYYNDFGNDGESRQSFVEVGQIRMKSSLWNSKADYLENSPVLNANKVVTPILLEVGGKDDRVPARQGLEFFNSLRRLHKPAWLLQYLDDGHSLDGKDAEDYTRRITGFFDHFLIGKPMPDWMRAQ